MDLLASCNQDDALCCTEIKSRIQLLLLQLLIGRDEVSWIIVLGKNSVSKSYGVKPSQINQFGVDRLLFMYEVIDYNTDGATCCGGNLCGGNLIMN